MHPRGESGTTIGTTKNYHSNSLSSSTSSSISMTTTSSSNNNHHHHKPNQTTTTTSHSLSFERKNTNKGGEKERLYKSIRSNSNSQSTHNYSKTSTSTSTSTTNPCGRIPFYFWIQWTTFRRTYPRASKLLLLGVFLLLIFVVSNVVSHDTYMTQQQHIEDGTTTTTTEQSSFLSFLTGRGKEGSSSNRPIKKYGNMQGRGSYSYVTSNNEVYLSDLIAASLQLSEIAGQEIVNVKNGNIGLDTHIKGQTEEGIDEPVTVADGNSNRIIVNGLRDLFPGIDILSEETEPLADPEGYHRITKLNEIKLDEDALIKLSDILITVDPLDATKEFTEAGTEKCEYDECVRYVTTMVGIVDTSKQGGKRPIAGIINQPFYPQTATTWGVILPSGKRQTSGFPALDSATIKTDTVVISRSHTGAGADVVTEYLDGHHPLMAGGSGYKGLTVIEGKAEAYVHVTKIKSWDVCAVDALIRAAGGEFTNLKGEHLIYEKDAPLIDGGIIATGVASEHSWYVEKLHNIQV